MAFASTVSKIDHYFAHSHSRISLTQNEKTIGNIRFDTALETIILNKWAQKQDIILFVAASGRLERLKEAIAAGYPVPRRAIRWAAQYGQLDCIIHLKNLGQKVDFSVAKLVVKYDHLHCLQFVMESASLSAYNIARLIVKACNFSQTECWIYLQKCYEASTKGNRADDIKELFGGICPWFAKNGQLESLRIAYGYGYEWDSLTTYLAAKYDHLDCLRFAHENGCDWDDKVCNIAAKRGHLRCLTYAHENGCPISESAYRNAAYWGRTACFMYAKDHIESPEKIQLGATHDEIREILEWDDVPDMHEADTEGHKICYDVHRKDCPRRTDSVEADGQEDQ